MSIKEKLSFSQEGLYLFETPSTLREKQRNAIYPHKLPLFSPDIYRTNRDRLFAEAQKLAAFDPLDGGDLLRTCYPIHIVNEALATTLMHDVSASPLFPNGQFTTDFQPENVVKQFSDTPIVTGSSSHAADELVLRSLFEKGVDPNTVAVIVFDSHFDGLYPYNMLSLKNNFAARLLSQGVGHMPFVGVPEDQCTSYLGGESYFFDYYLGPDGKKEFEEIQAKLDPKSSTQNPIDAFIHFVRNYQGFVRRSVLRELTHRYVIVPHRERIQFVTREQMEDEKSLTEQLSILFNKLKQNKKIRHLFISVDIDVLALFQEQITATDYSPFANILSFGLQMVDSENIMDANQFIDSARSSQGTPIGGISVENLCQTILFIQELASGAGLSYGIPFNNSRFVGSISEMNGPDLQQNTTRAVCSILHQLRK